MNYSSPLVRLVASLLIQPKLTFCVKVQVSKVSGQHAAVHVPVPQVPAPVPGVGGRGKV